MANIDDKITQIRQAIYGKDVRESIASGIEAINAEVENTTDRQTQLERDMATAKADTIQATKEANAARDSANTAANNANTKATLADEKAYLADEKATLADEKAILAQTAADNANAATMAINNETLIIYKPWVNTYNSIATTYPTPQVGWTTQTKDTLTRYRWNGFAWINIGVFTDDKIGDLGQIPETSLVEAIKNDRAELLNIQTTQYETLNENTNVKKLINSVDGFANISIGGNTVDVTTEKKIINFVGKITNSMIENSNIAKFAYDTSGYVNNTLLSPSSFTAEASDYSYGRISTLNSYSISIADNRNGYIPQQLFSFNILEEVKRKYGLTITVDQLKKMIKSFTCNWHGYGSCPTGNKANLTIWFDNPGNWNTSSAYTNPSTTSSTVSKLSITRFNDDSSLLTSAIDSNGFVHFLAYTDASDGVTASTIYTDYIELVIVMHPTLKSVGEDEGNKVNIVSYGKNLFNHNELANGSQEYMRLAQWVVPNSISTRLTLKNLIKVKPNVTYTLTVPNEYRGIIHQYDANLMPCTPDPGWVAGNRIVTTSSNTAFVNLYFSHPSNIVLTPDEVKNAVQFEEATSATEYEQYKGNNFTVSLYEPLRGLPNGTFDKIENGVLTRNIRLVTFNGIEGWSFTINYTNTVNFRTSVTGLSFNKTPLCDKFTGKIYNGLDEEGCYIGGSSDVHIRILKSKLTGYSDSLTNDEKVNLFKTWLQSNNVTVYYELATPIVENMKNKIILRSFKDGSVTVNTSITPTLTVEYPTNISYDDRIIKTDYIKAPVYAIANESIESKTKTNFVGKISESVIENPNIAKSSIGTLFLKPSEITWEFNADAYNNIKYLDNNTRKETATIENQFPKELFSFNVLNEVNKKYGLALTVEQLKTMIKNIIFKWYGYGSCPSGNKAIIAPFNTTSNLWSTTTLTSNSASISLLSYGALPQNIVGNDGFVHYLTYTDKARTTDDTMLVLTGHGLNQYDIIENTTRNAMSRIESATTTNTLTTYAITGQTAGDIVNKYKRYGICNTPCLSGTNTTTVVINNHGLVNGDVVSNITRGTKNTKITVVDANTFTCNTPITGQTVGDTFNLYHLLGQQTAESTVIPSTIYTDYVELEIEFNLGKITEYKTLVDKFEYIDGAGIVFKPDISSDVATLNVNNLGAVNIVGAYGGLKANNPYTLRYEITSNSFILQGKGGGGNATPSQILEGQTATVDTGQIVGTMPNRGMFNLGLDTVVPEGYYSGGNTAKGSKYYTGYAYVSEKSRTFTYSGVPFIPGCISFKINTIYPMGSGTSYTCFGGCRYEQYTIKKPARIYIAVADGSYVPADVTITDNSFTVTIPSTHPATFDGTFYWIVYEKEGFM